MVQTSKERCLFYSSIKNLWSLSVSPGINDDAMVITVYLKVITEKTLKDVLFIV